ncbi:MAG: dihydroorotate dehydrogenase-like protein [Bacteroidales bacterium]|nr:dihydroorotate dehydrogenase-like protein [Bacteroidales bacterium]
MSNLKTNYLGLELKNPVIAGASSFSKDVDGAKKLEDAGVAAIVYKSLFEEQIQLEEYEMDQDLTAYDDRHAEMVSLFPHIEHSGAKSHLYDLRKVKEAVGIPVIASLNCVYDVSWEEYAKELAETGIDALELNFYSTPKFHLKTAQEIEKEQIEVLHNVRKAVKIPISIKLSPHYTNPLNFIHHLDEAGLEGLVLFNKLFQADINIEQEENEFSYILSNEYDNRIALRYAALLYGNVKADIITSGGIHSGADAIKAILAGANAVQVVSSFYNNGAEYATTMLADIEAWMNKKGYENLNDFRGKLSAKNSTDPFAYKRSQYVDILLNSKKILEKTVLR